MPCSPNWYARQLDDLTAMAEKYGMPNFFLTLTADEVCTCPILIRHGFSSSCGLGCHDKCCAVPGVDIQVG